MAIEPKRGCGYRTVGGLYLMALGAGRACGKMPIRCDVCPTCNAGIKPSRGWTWIDPVPLFGERACQAPDKCQACPMGDANCTQLGPVGLLWIGEQFYRSPEAFLLEARRVGISRRIRAIPNGFVVGQTWVLLAHRKVRFGPDQDLAPGIFYLCQPVRIEQLVTASQAQDEAAMAKLVARDITPVVVPDDDLDHNPAAGADQDDDLDLFDEA
jgi:hypothetical protein